MRAPNAFFTKYGELYLFLTLFLDLSTERRYIPSTTRARRVSRSAKNLGCVPCATDKLVAPPRALKGGVELSRSLKGEAELSRSLKVAAELSRSLKAGAAPGLRAPKREPLVLIDK